MTPRLLLLILSIAGLYALPHVMGMWGLVGIGFAVAVIAASGSGLARRDLQRGGLYIAISTATYYILFKD